MKKIPTLFVRKFEGHKIVEVTPEITPGCEEAFLKGIATIKWDGVCCAIINGELYKRYDAKNGRKPPEGAIPCCDPDPITGHWPHWVKIDFMHQKPEDKWFVKAWANSVCADKLPEGTYEAIGPHFNGNPYDMEEDFLEEHGTWTILGMERTFESVRDLLEEWDDIEGIVFWLNGEPVCKIKRTDFGFEWPPKKEKDI